MRDTINVTSLLSGTTPMDMPKWLEAFFVIPILLLGRQAGIFFTLVPPTTVAAITALFFSVKLALAFLAVAYGIAWVLGMVVLVFGPMATRS